MPMRDRPRTGGRPRSATRSASGCEANRPPTSRRVRSQLIGGGGPSYDEWAARLHEAGLPVRGVAEGVRRSRAHRDRGRGDERGVRAGPASRASRAAWASGSSGRRSSCTAPTSRRRTSCRGIVDGTDRYCQGFSEPDAGSDLAGLKTRGVVDGDEIVVTGQKVWTSGAHRANMMFCLCRTDPDAPKHRGISYVLLPMKRPDGSSNGFELRPIRQITGNSNFSETFITEARAPLSNVIGGLHNGWRVTMTTLGNERGGNATTQHVQYEQQFWRIVDEVRRLRRRRRPARAPAARVGVHPRRDHALRRPAHALGGRRAQGAGPGGVDQQDVLVGVRPRPRRVGDEPAGRATRWCRPERRGLRARSVADATSSRSRSGTIWGGTAQVQRNIVGERVLGLPKEPETDAASGRTAVTDDERRGGRGRRGMTLAYWAARQPDDAAIICRARRPHVRRAERQREPAGAGAARPRRRERRRDRAAWSRTGPSSPRSVARVAARRLAAHADQLAPDRPTRPRYIVDDCEAHGARRRRRVRATPRDGGAPHAPGCAVRLAVGGDIDGFERYDDALAAEDGADIDDPVLGGVDALHVGHDRAAEGRAPRRQPTPRRPCSTVFGYDAGESTCTSAPARCTTPRRSRSRSRAPLHARRRRRADGRAGTPSETLRLDRGAPRHPHAHGADDVPPPALAARRRARRGTTSSSLRLVLHGAAPCPVLGEAAR